MKEAKMPVTKDALGRRSVQLEIEVPGTPEDVWNAIATGRGISSWFVPTDVEERDGGTVVCHLGPDISSRGTVTAWQPPQRFAFEERDWAGTAPPLASEFTIEARAGGTCRLRLVHSLFASTDAWDDQLESLESGWPSFFEVLRLYLGRYSGQPCSRVSAQGSTTSTESVAWSQLLRGLNLEGAQPGDHRRSPARLPQMSGVVHRIGQSKHREMLLLLDEPSPGAAILSAYTWSDRVMVSIALYLYGAGAAEVAAREEPRWRGWLQSAIETLEHQPR
jgi:uncharacterized protein YndB with AHSA1/START domain